jgi:hypothetical protein
MAREIVYTVGRAVAVAWTVYVFGSLATRFGLFDAVRMALQ